MCAGDKGDKEKSAGGGGCGQPERETERVREETETERERLGERHKWENTASWKRKRDSLITSIFSWNVPVDLTTHSADWLGKHENSAVYTRMAGRDSWTCMFWIRGEHRFWHLSSLQSVSQVRWKICWHTKYCLSVKLRCLSVAKSLICDVFILKFYITTTHVGLLLSYVQ